MQIVGERRNIQNITKDGIHHTVHEIPQNAEWRVRNMKILTKTIYMSELRAVSKIRWERKIQ